MTVGLLPWPNGKRPSPGCEPTVPLGSWSLNPAHPLFSAGYVAELLDISECPCCVVAGRSRSRARLVADTRDEQRRGVGGGDGALAEGGE